MKPKDVLEMMEAYASIYKKSEEQVIDEDLQGAVEKGLDAAAKNPVIKAIGKVIAPVGSGRKTATKTSGGYRPVAKEEVESEETQEVIPESQIGDRARKVVDDQRQGVHGDADAIKQDMDAININLRKMRAFPNGFPSVKNDTKKTTQVAHFEPEMDLFDVILEYLVAEGYADTNKEALVIMANMSEEWRKSIVEQMTDASTDSPSDENKSFSGEGPKKPKGWKPTGPKLKSGQRPGYAR